MREAGDYLAQRLNGMGEPPAVCLGAIAAGTVLKISFVEVELADYTDLVAGIAKLLVIRRQGEVEYVIVGFHPD